MSQAIQINDHGEVVRVYQTHLNDRLRAHGNQPLVPDGRCGGDTIERSAQAAWFLGALEGTIRTVQGGTIPVGLQGIVVDPNSRDAAQRQRASERRGHPLPGGNGSANGLRIVLCGEWGAVAPTRPISRVGKPVRIIFHHTDGHHPELDHQVGDSLDEAKAFARAIQQDHMHRRPAFIDSGHNFLVTRSGHILEGRHGSVEAVRAGVMVGSAHCIGQNEQPGIEHEHRGAEPMTGVQREASLALHEFICRSTGINPSAIHGHGEFNPTECPGVLAPGLPEFRRELVKRLAH
jgi:hypothetical protein